MSLHFSTQRINSTLLCVHSLILNFSTDYFYPYGGDYDRSINAEDNSSGALVLTQPFPFLGINETVVHVSAHLYCLC